MVTRANARFYVEAEDVHGAVRSLRKVFGIASLSVADVCEADVESIKKLVTWISREYLQIGDSFAIDARRDGGSYGFTSMDLEREIGAAVLAANSDRGVKVNLSKPDRTIFIEVRSGRAYIFTSYVRCHAGLPLGSQGRVAAYVNDDRGLVSAWLMMKRGCKVSVCGDRDVSLLRKYDPHLKTFDPGDGFPEKTLGVVSGNSLEQLGEVDSGGLPVFMPTIGMNDRTICNLIAQIKADRMESLITGTDRMKAVALISGGIDSPVASYLMSEAGADVILLHMSNGDFGDPKDLEKVVMISKQLESYTRKEFPVYVADHGRNQRIIQDNCDPHYQCVMCKRTMHRVAKKFAQANGASGIVMGDSLGQVASQTLMNIRAEQSGLDFPIFRPLIGLDKLEIIDIAKRIGTYEISIIKTSGCAAVPIGPVTEAKVEKVQEMQGKIDLDGMVDACFDSIRRVYRYRMTYSGIESWIWMIPLELASSKRSWIVVSFMMSMTAFSILSHISSVVQRSFL
ncbi:MAG: hypothetical protein E7Z69_03180 [Thermoplasmata archaeon]|nr:hypothetical protein [Thermoplasmata archaeon]